ncbi:MAG: Holliday junction resolvase RuvX [Pseudoflavonifractor sp.]|nr:Holliday junction resolvase RuvX [Pseudoflavonifractor sp.]
MGRLMSIDYGRKRCGIAVTDPMRIVANGLTTVATHQLVDFITKYTATESVDAIVVGRPTTMRGEPSESMQYIRAGITHLQRKLPEIPIVYWDERFTSVLAHRSMIDSGMKKSARRDKGTVDEISATIILNDYLQSRQFGTSSDGI